jgi:hypothetical protein
LRVGSIVASNGLLACVVRSPPVLSSPSRSLHPLSEPHPVNHCLSVHPSPALPLTPPLTRMACLRCVLPVLSSPSSPPYKPLAKTHKTTTHHQIAGRAFDEAKREALLMMPTADTTMAPALSLHQQQEEGGGAGADGGGWGGEEGEWDWFTMLGIERPKVCVCVCGWGGWMDGGEGGADNRLDGVA